MNALAAIALIAAALFLLGWARSAWISGERKHDLGKARVETATAIAWAQELQAALETDGEIAELEQIWHSPAVLPNHERGDQ